MFWTNNFENYQGWSWKIPSEFDQTLRTCEGGSIATRKSFYSEICCVEFCSTSILCEIENYNFQIWRLSWKSLRFQLNLQTAWMKWKTTHNSIFKGICKAALTKSEIWIFEIQKFEILKTKFQRNETIKELQKWYFGCFWGRELRNARKWDFHRSLLVSLDKMGFSIKWDFWSKFVTSKS